MTVGDFALPAEVSDMSDGALPFPPQVVQVKNTFVHLEDFWDEERTLQTWGGPGDKKLRKGTALPTDASDTQLAQSRETQDLSRQGQSLSMWSMFRMLTAHLKFGKAKDPCANDTVPPETPAATTAAGEATAPEVSAAVAIADNNLLAEDAPSVPCRQILASPRPPKKQRKGGVINKQSSLDREFEDGEWTPGTALRLAVDSESGSRAVVAAVSRPDVQPRIITDFLGHVVETASDPNAIHVLVSIVRESPEESAVFVAKELAGQGCKAASHKYACRLLCWMVQKRWKSDAFLSLIGEVLADSERMWQVHYASYVFQELLKHGTPDQQNRIVAALITSLARPEVARAIAQPQDAAEVESIFVLVSALTQCMKLASPLAQMLVGNASLVRELASRKFGFVLLRALLQYDGAERAQLGEALRAIGEDQLPILRERIAQPCKSCKSMPRRCQIAADAAAMFEGALASKPFFGKPDGFHVRA